MEFELEVQAQYHATMSSTGNNEKLDKENYHFPVIPNRQTPPTLQQNHYHVQQQQPQRQEQPEHLEKSKSTFPSWVALSTPSASKVNPSTLRASDSKTPIQSTPCSASSSVSQQRRTPTGSSKLLRDHYERLSMLEASTPSSAGPSLSGAGTSSSQQRRRLIDSGPVRLLPTAPQASPAHAYLMSPSIGSPVSSRRIGFDGTMGTPSRELLRATASSRNQRAVAPVMKDFGNISMEEDNSSTDRTITSSDHNAPKMISSHANTAGSPFRHSFQQYQGNFREMAISVPVVMAAAAATSRGNNNGGSYVNRRLDCGDPVAYTLWRGGDEDLPWLLEQDRRAVPKVSSNLSDVCGEMTDLAKPVPIMARPRSF